MIVQHVNATITITLGSGREGLYHRHLANISAANDSLLDQSNVIHSHHSCAFRPCHKIAQASPTRSDPSRSRRTHPTNTFSLACTCFPSWYKNAHLRLQLAKQRTNDHVQYKGGGRMLCSTSFVCTYIWMRGTCMR